MPFYPYQGTVQRLRAQNPELDAAVAEMHRQLEEVSKLLKLIAAGDDEDDPVYARYLAKLGIQALEGTKPK